jgi:enoyl-[acyl-carrier protein] reductase I
MSDPLQLRGQTVLVAGLATRRSVAWATIQALQEAGAEVIATVHTAGRLDAVRKLFPEGRVEVCDVEKAEEIEALGQRLAADQIALAGLVHSIAYGNLRDAKAFEETSREDFLQAVQISAFSLVELTEALLPCLQPGGSIVATSISSLETTAPTYGMMSPAKAALEGCVRFLAGSLGRERGLRVNAVKAGPLKTQSSAGIPGYIENYLHAEQMTFRKAGVRTEEVAETILWLLSPRSSGVTGQGIVVDAGMGLNAFDPAVVKGGAAP